MTVFIFSSFGYADLDGKNRHIVLEGVPHPFSISLFEDVMYWTDWNHLTIERANKFTGANHTILWNVTHRPMDVHVFHPLKQKPGLTLLKKTLSDFCSIKCVYHYFGYSILISDCVITVALHFSMTFTRAKSVWRKQRRMFSLVSHLTWRGKLHLCMS